MDGARPREAESAGDTGPDRPRRGRAPPRGMPAAQALTPPLSDTTSSSQTGGRPGFTGTQRSSGGWANTEPTYRRAHLAQTVTWAPREEAQRWKYTSQNSPAPAAPRRKCPRLCGTCGLHFPESPGTGSAFSPASSGSAPYPMERDHQDHGSRGNEVCPVALTAVTWQTTLRAGVSLS